jgi:CheY-like chemotaxis protein
VTTLAPKKRVLLADDDASLRRLIGATLGDEHFDLLQAVDGKPFSPIQLLNTVYALLP